MLVRAFLPWVSSPPSGRFCFPCFSEKSPSCIWKMHFAAPEHHSGVLAPRILTNAEPQGTYVRCRHHP